MLVAVRSLEDRVEERMKAHLEWTIRASGFRERHGSDGATENDTKGAPVVTKPKAHAYCLNKRLQRKFHCQLGQGSPRSASSSLDFRYALSCTTLRVVGITTRSVVQLNLPTQNFRLDDALCQLFA